MTKATLVRASVYSKVCPACQSVNYYDVDFDPEDSAGHDIDALECWNCEHKWLTEGVDWIDDIEDAWAEKGRKKP